MINEKELLIANTSYTKKDFYQIYPEILDLVQKITERWDPQSSNESDPGVVLLKLLAFIADKNIYNMDKIILECFMPSATQETSMRKLCEMMGYNMSYYKSATTKVHFMYQGDLIDTINPDTGELIDTITLKAFDTSIKDESDSINYVLLEDVILGTKYEEKSAAAIEGSLNYCTVGSSNIIKLVNLDDNKRFYLPETMIAENGIFVKNAGVSWSDRWNKIDNLNTQVIGSKVWKFGIDSNKRLPYIEFPEDINALIENGLEIAYVVTTGANGNIKANVLTKLANNVDSNGISLVDDNNVSTMVVSNISATSNGSDYETLDEAYNNFKRTIGTFDTLVTCRDYANKIYQLVKASDNTTPLVSNIQVSDIRDDINRRDTITTYGGYGLVWEDVSHDDAINHFDLYFYPFGAIVGSYNLDSYKNSFRPSYANISEIEYELNNYKTIAHKINYPEEGDIYCIKNMYNLKAKITTTYKVTSLEETQILNAISTALYKKFNMRNVDFGEEIPFDAILECIQNADTRIKNVSLEEPTLTTKYMLKNGVDYDLLTDRATYIKLIAKNVMAGRIPLFAYDNRFEYEYGNSKFTKIVGGTGSDYDEVYGYDENDSTKPQIVSLETEVTITPPTIDSPYTLKPNEVVQMMAPSFKTTLTYPAYINYHFKSSGSLTDAIACVATEAVGGNAPTSQADLNAGKTIGEITYPYYTRTLTSKPVGRLVGTDGGFNYLYKLAASTIYNPSTTYYLIGINEADTIGADAIIPGIKANQEYKLESGDILYINYTDSNDNIINIKYEYNQITTNGIVEADLTHVIIKPNFEIKDSALLHTESGVVWVKTSGFQSSWSIEGMFSIGTNQQIDIRDYVKNTLISPTFCYWLIKDGTIPFIDDEYILQDSEYFFYTNEAKTELVILGSGTKLINHDVAISNFTIDYTEAKLDIDEVSNNGLAAFAGDPWKLIQFRADVELEIQEMQFITLIEGDILNKVTLSSTEAPGSLINNDFKNIDFATYTIKGSSPISLNELATEDDSWQIRSRLDLNMGPELQQKLDIKQKIVLYDNTETAIITLEPSILLEEIKYPYLKSNILLQMAGNKLLNAPVTITEEEELYNLNIMVSSYSVSQYDKMSGDTPIEENATLIGADSDDYNRISLKTANNIRLNVLIPDSSNTFGIMMLYYNKKSDLAPEDTGATLTAGGAYLQYYNGEDDPTNTITLKDGINIIKITNSTLLTIGRNNDKEGILVIGKYKIVKNPDVNPDEDIVQLEGVDYQTLGLNPLGTVTITGGEDIPEANYLLDYIKEITTIEGSDIFYYNCPIDNSLLIDHEDMSSPLAWYDYNNICNKFVISELDADKFEKGISLTKSSKL